MAFVRVVSDDSEISCGIRLECRESQDLSLHLMQQNSPSLEPESLEPNTNYI